VTIKEMLYKFVATRNVPYNIPSLEEKTYGLGSDQAKCMIEQNKSDNSWSLWALECPFWS